MKIVYLSPARTPPTMTMKFAQALVDGGAEVSVWSVQEGTEEFYKGIVRSNVAIRRFPSPVYAGERRCFHQLYRYGLGLIPKPSYLAALMTCGADVFIAGNPDDLPIAAFGALVNRAGLVYIPFDYFPGVLDATPELSRRWRWLEQRYSRVVKAWISLGDKLSDKYVQEYPELRNRIHTIYTSYPKHIACDARVLRKRIGVDSSTIVVLYQGVISKARGLWDVVDAMPYLSDNIHFVVVGGYENAELRAYAESRKVANRVHVLDFVPQKELPSYTFDADIGIIPIRPACESYKYCNPSKLFEFLSMGLPLAVSGLEQLRWYVTEHGLGEVFDPGSVEGIVNAIQKLAADREYRRRCALNSKTVHETQACWEIQSERLRRVVLGPSEC